MKKPGPPLGPPERSRPGKGGRKFTEDDRAVWQHTASSLQPLKRPKGRVLAALEDMPPTEPFPSKGLQASLPPVPAAKLKPAMLPAAAQPQPAPKKQPPLADFDSKRARKLRTGQVDIDARIDLHGMRQSEAYTALRGFLHACHRKGHSVVLVITGKGAPPGSKPEGAWGDQMGRSERGVLRRNVPQWLAEPELRAIVVSFTSASIRHGGDGALYVHLRRLR
ncbi:MAG: Smr/MutS family protein [Hyphomicrobiaceae bacterium]|nr:Smr/MutS family protein [Hyphomicrobiaceae bacterium]